jgi:hypothetical protein
MAEQPHRIDIEKHRALGRAATPRPWYRIKFDVDGRDRVRVAGLDIEGDAEASLSNSDFVIEIANDHAAMLDELEALRAVGESATKLSESIGKRDGGLVGALRLGNLRVTLDRWRNGGGDEAAT